MSLGDMHTEELLLRGKGTGKTELFSPHVLGKGCDGEGPGKSPEAPFHVSDLRPLAQHLLECGGLYLSPSPGGRGSLPTSYTFSSSFQGHELFFERPCSRVQTLQCTSCFAETRSVHGAPAGQARSPVSLR